MVTARVMIEKTVSHLFSAVFHPILFILAINDDMQEGLGLKMSDGRETNIPNNQKKKLLLSSPFNAKIQNVIKFLFEHTSPI